jgi:hypothetical protein
MMLLLLPQQKYAIRYTQGVLKKETFSHSPMNIHLQQVLIYSMFSQQCCWKPALSCCTERHIVKVVLQHDSLGQSGHVYEGTMLFWNIGNYLSVDIVCNIPLYLNIHIPHPNDLSVSSSFCCLIINIPTYSSVVWQTEKMR